MKRVYCPHCKETVSRSTFYNHKILYSQKEAKESNGATIVDDNAYDAACSINITITSPIYRTSTEQEEPSNINEGVLNYQFILL